MSGVPWGETRLVQGNEAVALGALAAGIDFFAGYPITPSTEVAEILAREMPLVAKVDTDGRRDRKHKRHNRRKPGGRKVHDRHQRPGLQPDAGGTGIRLHDRGATGSCECNARRSFHRSSHTGFTG